MGTNRKKALGRVGRKDRNVTEKSITTDANSNVESILSYPHTFS